VTASQTVKASTASRRRPRDRRAQILHIASELFTKYGFHAVRMEDIAEATDVTARAIYRHFANKQDLLSQVVLEDQDRLLMAAQSAESSESGVCSLEQLLTLMVEASLESLRLGPYGSEKHGTSPPMTSSECARVLVASEARCEGPLKGPIPPRVDSVPTYARGWQ
jgi:AcrR family transcriptional regulator